MSQNDLKIGPKIKAFRRQLGLQANKLAQEINISPSYLNLIEGGKRKIDGDLLLKICEKLNIELSQLTSKDDVNLEDSKYDYKRLLTLNDHVDGIFKERIKKIRFFEKTK